MRIVEIHHIPLLKARFPEETEHIDTNFSFVGAVGLMGKLRRAIAQFARLLKLTMHGRCDLVFCRAMGRFIYRRDASLFSNGLRVIMGWCILLCVGSLVRRGARLGVVDVEDEATLDPRDLFLLRRCERYFKRELPQNAWNALARFRGRHSDHWDLLKDPAFQKFVGKFEPLSLGIALDRCRRIEETLDHEPSPKDKRYDVFFSGVLDHSTVRVDGERHLRALRAKGYRVEFHTGHVPYEEFVGKMRASWLVWSPEGAGWDCYRHYEAPVAGAVPLVNHATIHRYAPLLPGVHCVEYAIEQDDLCHRVEAALADKEKLWQMTLAARAQVLRHHTHPALGEYLRDTLAGESAVTPSDHDQPTHHVLA